MPGFPHPGRLMLRTAENGGWIIEEGRDFQAGRIVGAYTDTRDMLDALEELLLGASAEVEHIRAEQGGVA